MADTLQWQITGLWRPSHTALAQLPFYGQIADPRGGEVYIPLNDKRTAEVSFSVTDPIALALPPGSSYARFLRAYYRGRLVFWGAINNRNVKYQAGTVTIKATDRLLSLIRHFLRRGDAMSTPALMSGPNDEAKIEISPTGLLLLRDAGLNIAAQNMRDMPDLGVIDGDDDGTHWSSARAVGVKRGDQVDSTMRSLSENEGPDYELEPIDDVVGAYARLNTYGHQGEDVSALVAFHYATGLNNLADLEESEGGEYITHVHVLDREGRYRVTRANRDASFDTGAYVRWEAAEFDSTDMSDDAIEAVLAQNAQDILRAWSRPLAAYDLTLKLGTDEQLQYGRDYNVGDIVGIAGLAGHMRLNSDTARITGVRLKQANDDNQVQPVVEVVANRAVVDEITVEDDDDPALVVDSSPPTVMITSPATGATVSGPITITAAAGDDVGVVGVQFKLDGVPLGAEDTTAPYSIPWDTDTATEASHTLRATARDAAGHTTTSTVVTVTVDHDAPPPPPPGSNFIYADGTRLRRRADDTILSGRGMNVHSGGFSFAPSHWASMASVGINSTRLCAIWKYIEPSAGYFDETQIEYIRTSIARAAAAGLKTKLCLQITAPQWPTRSYVLPSWTYTSSGPASPVAPFNTQSLFDCFVSQGQAYVQRMVQEFGADPNVYAIEFHNEPDRYPASLVQAGTQRMLEWARAVPEGADTLWAVATTSYSSQSADDAFNDWDLILDWTNLLATVHCYWVPPSPTATGWDPTTGMRISSQCWNGGSGSPTAYNPANAAAFVNHFEPFEALSVARDIPWLLGEVGVPFNRASPLQRDQWVRDVLAGAAARGCAGADGWIYGVDEHQDEWTARYPAEAPVWRPEYSTRFGAYVAP